MKFINFLPWRNALLLRKKYISYAAFITSSLPIMLVGLKIHYNEIKKTNQLKENNAYYQRHIKSKNFFEIKLGEIKKNEASLRKKINELKTFTLSHENEIFQKIAINMPSTVYLESIKKEKRSLTLSGKTTSYKNITELEKNLSGIKMLKSEKITALENKQNYFIFSLQIEENFA